MKGDQTPWRRACCTWRRKSTHQKQALSKPCLSCLVFEELLCCWKIHKREQIKHWWFGSSIRPPPPPLPPPSLQVNNLSVNINNAVTSIYSITRVIIHRTNEISHRWDSAAARSRLRRARALSIATQHTLIAEKGWNSDRRSPSVSWRVLNCHLEETTGEIRPKPPARRTVRNPLVGKELALWFLQEAPTDAITGCSQEVESAVSMLTCQLGWNWIVKSRQTPRRRDSSLIHRPVRLKQAGVSCFDVNYFWNVTKFL